jgi:hypothetical protein
MTRSDLIGSEFDWYAIDRDGFIAVFCSAGWGPVPEVVFDHLEGQKSIGSEIKISNVPVPDIEFKATSSLLSEKGIFGYNWLNTFGPYRSFSQPTQPKTFFELRLGKEAESALVKLPGVQFSGCLELQGKELPAFTDVNGRRGGVPS